MPGDLLVLNDSRVIPARLLGRRSSGGRVELHLVEPSADVQPGEPARWLVMAETRAAMTERYSGRLADFRDALARAGY